jgi:hypothetical protein
VKRSGDAPAFDAAGNRTAGGLVIGAGNRLLHAGTVFFTYDVENLTKRIDAATGYSVGYARDVRNRLTPVTDTDLSTPDKVIFTYDSDDRLVVMKVLINNLSIGSERYLYEGDARVAKAGAAGDVTHRYIHGPGVDSRVVTHDAGVVGVDVD